MLAVEKVIEEFSSLNEQHKEEVIDFIEFLKQKENKMVEKVAEKVFVEYDEVFKNLSRTYFSTTYLGSLEGVTTYHSSIVEDNYLEMVVVYFEKGDCHAEFLLPNRVWLKFEGFDNKDLVALREYALNNEPLMWETVRGVYGGE